MSDWSSKTPGELPVILEESIEYNPILKRKSEYHNVKLVGLKTARILTN